MNSARKKLANISLLKKVGRSNNATKWTGTGCTWRWGGMEGYKTWLAKQHTGFCGTRVQVGYYFGKFNGDVSCTNGGDKKMAAHLYMCPNKDRVKFFTEGLDNIKEWIKKLDNTEL